MVLVSTQPPTRLVPLPQAQRVTGPAAGVRLTPAERPGVGTAEPRAPVTRLVVAPLAVDETVVGAPPNEVELLRLRPRASSPPVHRHGARLARKRRLLAVAQAAVSGVLPVRAPLLLSG